METLGDSNNNANEGFFKYVFNFDDSNKNLLLNLFQYSFLAVSFIVLILKLMNHYTPEEDDSKGTLEILVEIVTSLSVILLSIWFINRIIRYIPTISKTDYHLFNETNFILPVFVVLFTMQTKLGSKINILVERLVDLYDGKTNLKESKDKANKKDYKTTQPISQGAGHQPSQSDFRNAQHAQNSQGHSQTQMNNMVQPPPAMPTQQASPTFNNSFQGPDTPLIGASEPMAANEAFGGSMFGGSAF